MHAGDRAALVALYNATAGENWTDNTNWLSDEPLGEWQGVTTNDQGRVVELHLWQNNLTGAIPSQLGSLSNLERMYLDSNQLSGEIPSELGDLSNLERLSLSRNQLSGEIPEELSSLSNLTELQLCCNELSGEIPSELSSLLSLEQMSLDGNQLSGGIPSELGSLSNLERMHLHRNQLSGEIPSELGDLANLQRLALGGNELSGRILAEFGNLASLAELSLWGNELSGEIPAELGRLANLTLLFAGENQLSGEIPSELGDLSNLERLSLPRNHLSGEIPEELSSLSNLTELQLCCNELSGEIPSELGRLSKLERLYLLENQFSGGIPSELGRLSNLRELRLQDNSLSGSIPSELGNLQNLEWLWLSRNELTGAIPPELGSLSNLSRLFFSSNELTGEIPAELGDLPALEILYFEDNELTGEIPVELSNLTKLRHLSLKGNQLSGTVPLGFRNFSQIYLFYFDNNAGLCATDDAALQNWLQAIPERDDGPNCEDSSPTEISYAFQNFHVISHNLNEYGNHDAECKSRLGNQYRLADWNDLKSWVDDGGSVPNLITGLRLSWEGVGAGPSVYPHDGNGIDVRPRVSYNGNGRWNNGRRHFFISRQDHVRPSSFLAHDHIDNYHITLGSWFGVGGTVLCYDSTSEVPESTSFGNFKLTTGKANYPHEAVAAVQNEFGSEWRVADWNDLRAVWGAHQDSIKTAFEGGATIVTWNGEAQWGNTQRTFFVEDHNGSKPGYFLAHDELGGHEVSLGSWTIWEWGHDGLRTLAIRRDGAQPPTDPTPVHAGDRAALVALYNATGGDNWTTKHNWLSDKPLGEWQGVSTDDAGRVTELNLQENNLTGQIPSEVGNLSSLIILDMDSNRLSGSMPSALGNLANLQKFDLSDNELDGPVPSQMGNLANLRILNLHTNQVSGEIPSELGRLSNLEELILLENQLTGEIPSELGNLSNLTQLYLWSNDLSGEIPAEIGNLSSLTGLAIQDNQLSGVIPPELGKLSNLVGLHAWGNQLTGSIPSELGNLSDLESLWLDLNQLTGAIPSELGDLSNLTELTLWRNQLTGEIPSELSNLSKLTNLELGRNQLTGEIPAELGELTNLEKFSVSGNQITGEIPAVLGGLSKLRHLYLRETQLSGEIPVELGNLSDLEHLALSYNNLTGGVPTELGNLTKLELLYLYGNQLTDPLPDSLTNLIALERFAFGDNDGLCAPTDEAFQAWLRGIANEDLPDDVTGTGPNCGEQPTSEPFKLEVLDSRTHAEVGQPFEITVKMHDVQQEVPHGGISVSFPDLKVDGGGEDGYSSDLADVEWVQVAIDDSEAVSGVKFFQPGEGKIHPADGGQPDDAEYLLVESDESWEAGDERTLTLSITPKQEGEFRILVRGWICASVDENGKYDDCTHLPEESDTLDQQSWPAEELPVDVAPAATGCSDDPINLGELTTDLSQEDLYAEGTWTSDCDSINREGSYARFYNFTLTQAATAQVDLSSNFDTYLYLLEADGSQIESDDSTGLFDEETRVSRYLLPRTYIVEVSTRDREQTGFFNLNVAVVGFALPASPETFGEPFEALRFSDESDSEHYWVFVPSNYTFEEERYAEGIHDRIKDRDDRIEIYRRLLIEIATQPAARSDVVLDLHINPDEIGDINGIYEQIRQAYSVTDQVASATLGKHLDILPSSIFLAGNLATWDFKVRVAAAYNRTTDIKLANSTLNELKEAVRNEEPSDIASWEVAFSLAEQDIRNMTSDEELRRWAQAVEDNIDELKAIAINAAVGTTIQVGGKVLATKLAIISAPITAIVGLASINLVIWGAIIEDTDRFWDGMTDSAFAAQAHLLLHRKGEAPRKTLNYTKFSFYQHLHEAAGVGAHIFDIGSRDSNRPQDNRGKILRKRDLALRDVLDREIVWDPTEDFNTLDDAGGVDAQGIWSDGTTMWVADVLHNAIRSYQMTTKNPNANQRINLCLTAATCNTYDPRGIWSDIGNMWVVARVQTGSIHPYRILRYSHRTGNLERIARLDAGNTDPTGIWSDGITLWVADDGDDKLYAYYLSTDLNVLERDPSKDLTLATENAAPRGIWSDGTALWVADDGGDKIYTYNLSNGERDETGEIDLLHARSIVEGSVSVVVDNGKPTGIWSDGTTMWVADHEDDKIYAYGMPEGVEGPDTSLPELSLESHASNSLIEVGESFTLTVEMHLTEGEGEHGGISVSFPQLDEDGGGERSHSSSIADVEWVPAQSDQREGVSGVTFYQPGEGKIHPADGDQPAAAEYLLVESDESWGEDDERTLTLSITPKQEGKFQILVRGWICASVDENGKYDDCTHLPEAEDSDALDQQSWPVERLSVNVRAADSGAPDLVVSSFSVSRQSVTPGERVTLYANVYNQGDVATGQGTYLHYYRSDDGVIDNDDTEVGSDYVNVLGVGASNDEDYSRNVPQTEGTYHYYACVEELPNESDKNNNCSETVEVTVATASQGGPDLVVYSTSVYDKVFAPGERFQMSFRVQNQGGGASASAATMSYYRSEDATISPSLDEKLAIHSGVAGSMNSSRVGQIAADGSSQVIVYLDAHTYGHEQDTYYYGACVEAVPGESNANNNCAAVFKVSLPTEDLVVQASDLVVEAAVSDRVVEARDKFKLNVRVRNDGNKKSSTTTLRYYRSGDATEVGTKKVKSITRSRSYSISLEAPSKVGTYFYYACVDPVDSESDTSNNCSASVLVTVTLPGQRAPDLVVDPPIFSSVKPTEGTSVILGAVTVSNLGKVASHPTTVRLQISLYSDFRMHRDKEVWEVPGIRAGGTYRTPRVLTFSVPLIVNNDDTYYYRACVDHVAGETSTSNNCSSAVSLTLTPQ